MFASRAIGSTAPSDPLEVVAALQAEGPEVGDRDTDVRAATGPLLELGLAALPLEDVRLRQRGQVDPVPLEQPREGTVGGVSRVAALVHNQAQRRALEAELL